MFWRSIVWGLGCGLFSASILAATLVPRVVGRPQLIPAETLGMVAPQQVQFYYTPWGPASLVPSRQPNETLEESAAGSEPPWRWEDASLYHFTKPGPGTAIGDSPVGRKLAELYDSRLEFLAAGTRARFYASFTGGAYDLNASQRAQAQPIEGAQLNLLPEPSPLTLLITGIACILLAKGLRRSRQTP